MVGCVICGCTGAETGMTSCSGTRCCSMEGAESRIMVVPSPWNDEGDVRATTVETLPGTEFGRQFIGKPGACAQIRRGRTPSTRKSTRTRPGDRGVAWYLPPRALERAVRQPEHGHERSVGLAEIGHPVHAALARPLPAPGSGQTGTWRGLGRSRGAEAKAHDDRKGWRNAHVSSGRVRVCRSRQHARADLVSIPDEMGCRTAQARPAAASIGAAWLSG